MVLPAVVVVTVIAMVIDMTIVVVAMVVLVKIIIVEAPDTIPMIVAIGVIEMTTVVGALTDTQALVKTEQTDMLGVKIDVADTMDVMRNVVLAIPVKIATMAEVVEVATIVKTAMRRGKVY